MDRAFPEDVPDIAAVASALADQSRAAMCAAMMDGRAWTAGELGTYCHLAKSTTSKHIDRLVETGIVTQVRQGRHRYLRLASDDVAAVIEQLGVLSAASLPTPPSLCASHTNQRIRAGRTCYKHLAGQLGAGLTEQLQRRGYLSPEWQLTVSGQTLLSSWGISKTDTLTARPCMDSTERRFHLAGPLGTQVCTVMFTNGWLDRVGTTRAVRLTPAGQAQVAADGLTPLMQLPEQLVRQRA